MRGGATLNSLKKAGIQTVLNDSDLSDADMFFNPAHHQDSQKVLSPLCFRPMETIKYTIGLVFQLVFGVAAIGTYFNMLQLPRLEAESNSFVHLVHFIISMGLT